MKNPPDLRVGPAGRLVRAGDATKSQYVMRRPALEEELQRQGSDFGTFCRPETPAAHAGVAGLLLERIWQGEGSPSP